MTRFTVLGSRGFIGSHLSEFLRMRGHDVFTPLPGEDVSSTNLGIVFYSIGVTADFRERPRRAVESHVSHFSDVVSRRHDSIVYLSSTRVYRGAAATSEAAVLAVRPGDFDHLYNISKLMGESVALHIAKAGKVARLSNVYGGNMGPTNFLGTIIDDAIRQKVIHFQTALDSAKDYVSVDDTCRLLYRIATEGRHSIYNVASGRLTTHGAIAEALTVLTGCRVSVADDAPSLRDAPIDVTRVESEFAFEAEPLLEKLPSLIEHFRAGGR